MANLTGVFQHGSAFYLRIVLPKGHPLSALYRNGRFVKSLDTCSHREAFQRGLAKRAKVLCGSTPVVQLPALAPVAHSPAPPRDRFTWIKPLLKYATRDLQAIPKSPWEGLDIAHRTTARRRPWSPDELTTLFSQPLFTQYELPRNFKAGKDAAY